MHKFKLLLGLTVSLALLGLSIVRIVFRISVVCDGQCLVVAKDQVAQLNGSTYFNLVRTTKDLTQQAGAQNITLTLTPSLTWKVGMVLRAPVVAVRQSEGYALVDETGVVTGISQSTSLPVMGGLSREVKQGDVLDHADLIALKLTNLLFMYYSISSTAVSGDTLVTSYKSVPEVVFPLDDDFEYILGEFSLVLSRLNQTNQDTTIESNVFDNIRSIDLRFNNPVIKYNNE